MKTGIIFLFALVCFFGTSWKFIDDDETPIYYILTDDGSVYKNGMYISQIHHGIKIAAGGDEYYVLARDGEVYENEMQKKILPGAIDIAASDSSY